MLEQIPLQQFWIIDFPALIIIILASVQCALLGSFLILKEQAVMVDAISHSVLPGVVMGVVLSGTFSMIYVMGGALTASLIAVILVRLIQKWGNISQGAAIGTVFTTMFALGVILLETQVGSSIHLDTQHVLYGALELTYWENPFEWHSMPAQIKTLSIMLLATIAYIAIAFKEIRLSIFDPLHAEITGVKTYIYNITIMILTALVAVSCFEATGSILVIALFICPAATARLICNTVKAQLWVSVTIALTAAIAGYFCANALPLILGFENTINTAATVAFMSGTTLLITCTLKIKWEN